MVGIIARRLWLGGITLLAVTFIMFSAVTLLPGDACSARLGRAATPASLAKCRASLPDQGPLLLRYVHWAGHALTGDFGQSVARQKPVGPVILLRFRNTLVLALAAALIGFPVAILLGVIAALRRDGFLDVLVSTVALTAMTVPEFVSATALVLVFSIWLHWLPGINIVPPDAPLLKLVASITTPALVLAFLNTAHVLRMVRSCVLDVLESPFVQMAHLRGIPYLRVIFLHVLPSALLPAISLLAMQFAWLLGGVVVVEVVLTTSACCLGTQ